MAERQPKNPPAHLSVLKTEPAEPIHGVVVGRLLALYRDGTAQVIVASPADLAADFRGPLRARAAANLSASDVGREVALLFERGRREKPIVIGLMEISRAGEGVSDAGAIGIEIDGERMVFKAAKEIVLACGKASVTLTRAGKIILKGAYLLSRSSGVNRIQGGSVQIN